MAVDLSSFGFVFLLQSLIALYVTGTEQAFLSVKAPVVYIVAGKSLSLDCIINGTSLSASQVSWKHEGKWLHNHTQQQGTKVQLLLRNVKRQDNGTYQCGVFNLSGLSPKRIIPKDVNVTILVGGPVSKPMCISNGLTPAKISLIWNAIDDCQSVYPFTYNVLYCHKPSGNNSFCFRPPRGYNIYRDCTGLIVNSSSGVGSMVVECNVTSLFKRLFPDAWRGIPKITFSINIGNVPSDAYSKFSTCNPLELVKCTKPVNIRVNNLKKRTLSLTWDAPKDMGEYTKLLLYEIVHAADGTIHSNETPITSKACGILVQLSNLHNTKSFISLERELIPEKGKCHLSSFCEAFHMSSTCFSFHKSTDFVSRDLDQVVNISYDITGLHPYTMYHIYIACSINAAYKEQTLGEFIGLSARTAEEEPSHYPTISDNYISSILHGEYRNVTLHWKLPDNKTWNGVIIRTELHYWKANSPMSRNDACPLVMLSNVSMTTGTASPAVLVLSNVSMTTGTLTYLQLKETYAVVAKICTRVGCGPCSQSILITPLDFPDGTAKLRTKEQGYFYVIIGVTLAVLLCIACAILTVYLWKKRLRRRRKQDDKKLSIMDKIGKLPPPSHPYESASGPSKIEESGDYDDVIEPLLGVDKEYVLVAPQPESPTSKTSQDDEADIQHSSEV